MGLAQRKQEHYIYADYCRWGDDQRWELIDGVAYAMAPATTAFHQIVAFQIVKRQVYERAGVAEYWLVHPVDRVLTIYRLENGRYGIPDIRELIGATPVGPLPGSEIVWEDILARLPPEAE